MSELATRAKLELEKQRLSVTHNLAWLEQALLAERRLAMEECAEIVAPREMHTHLFPHQYKYCNVCPIAAKLRAAAEKEAGTR